MCEKITQSLENLKNKAEKYHYMDKAFIYIFLLYLIGISSLIRANFNYIDDLGRVFSGYKGWENFSRYTSVFLSEIIHADEYLTDVSPLPQIIAIFFLSIASVLVIHILKDDKKQISLWEIIAVVPLGLNPYFLECLSYKYDSPYMALSILASVIPVMFIKSSRLIYSILSILCLLIMLTTYQAASGIYPMLIVLLFVKNILGGYEKFLDTLKIAILSAPNYIIAIIIFRLFIMKPFDDYVSSSLAELNQIIPQWSRYYTWVAADFKDWWIGAIIIIILTYLLGLLQDTKQMKIKAFGLGIAGIFLCLCLCFGMYPFLSEPSYSTRAMYGIGVFVALIAVSCVGKKRAWIARIASLSLSWAFFVFSFTYGNALSEQSRYTDFRVETVINDIRELEIFNSEHQVIVQLEGNIGNSPVIKNMPKDYKMLDRLLPDTFCANWWWGEYYFRNYFGLKQIMISDSSIDLTEYNLPIIKDTIYHTIKGNDNYILIELK